MQVTSGSGAKALMGAAEGKSMFYLELRCDALARATGAQGVRHGGIDAASMVGSVPGGMREPLAENLLVMLREPVSPPGPETGGAGVRSGSRTHTAAAGQPTEAAAAWTRSGSVSGTQPSVTECGTRSARSSSCWHSATRR